MTHRPPTTFMARSATRSPAFSRLSQDGRRAPNATPYWCSRSASQTVSKPDRRTSYLSPLWRDTVHQSGPMRTVATLPALASARSLDNKSPSSGPAASFAAGPGLAASRQPAHARLRLTARVANSCKLAAHSIAGTRSDRARRGRAAF